MKSDISFITKTDISFSYKTNKVALKVIKNSVYP